MAAIPREQVVKVRAELSNAIVVRPGDMLIVGLSVPLRGPEEARDVSDRIAAQVPGVNVTVIDNVAGFAVYRPGEAG